MTSGRNSAHLSCVSSVKLIHAVCFLAPNVVVGNNNLPISTSAPKKNGPDFASGYQPDWFVYNGPMGNALLDYSPF